MTYVNMYLYIYGNFRKLVLNLSNYNKDYLAFDYIC